ncbi:membrane protein, partial [Vibrio parahaemolyticus]
MKKQLVKHELRLMGVAIFSAFLLVFAHLILAKSFSHMVWTEYTAAVIPFSCL